VTTHKYIINIDDLYWRVAVSVKGVRKVKCFNFANFRGKRKAMEYAKAWRDKWLEDHELLWRLDYKHAPDSYKATARIPIIGVYITKTRQSTGIFLNWTVRYAKGGTECKKHFSINKYGYDEAFQMACKVRYQYCGVIRLLKNVKLKPDVPWVRVYSL